VTLTHACSSGCYTTISYLYASTACVYNENKQMDTKDVSLKESDAWPAQPQVLPNVRNRMTAWYRALDLCAGSAARTRMSELPFINDCRCEGIYDIACVSLLAFRTGKSPHLLHRTLMAWRSCTTSRCV
jgi:hypothetical protein